MLPRLPQRRGNAHDGTIHRDQGCCADHFCLSHGRFTSCFNDAEIAASALGIALTKRGKHQGEDIPMCGVPVHAADDYLQG